VSAAVFVVNFVSRWQSVHPKESKMIRISISRNSDPGCDRARERSHIHSKGLQHGKLLLKTETGFRRSSDLSIAYRVLCETMKFRAEKSRATRKRYSLANPKNLEKKQDTDKKRSSQVTRYRSA
jgi:hypothetical protein